MLREQLQKIKKNIRILRGEQLEKLDLLGYKEYTIQWEGRDGCCCQKVLMYIGGTMPIPGCNVKTIPESYFFEDEEGQRYSFRVEDRDKTWFIVEDYYVKNTF